MKTHTCIEILTRQECLRLLAGEKVGRLGFVVGDQPMIMPVNYALVGDVIVFRTGEGPKLDGSRQAKVVFEVDWIENQSHDGWSVLVQGIAQEITDHDDLFAEDQRQAVSPTWLPVVPGHFVRIVPTVISGRRLPIVP